MAHLVKHHHFSVIGGFVEITDDNRVIEIANYIESEADLCRITSYVENKEKIVPVILHLSERKVLKLIEASFDLHLQNDLFDIFSKMNATQQKKIVAVLGKLPTKIMNDIEKHLLK
ncbi:MAG: hypothetical protein IPQ19_14330 [Bacteroidetes bacterium]|nr:hypothetical protein [Bacteroidota bacterium]